ncbi:EamA family transporter [Streptantibioticus rubrisoli]|uniref:EamA family transporter n=1 Tax=Streptantibioticus rubrisoli TaxID=1387313 RepID=A0ABT1P7Y8_9ACTN|nr:EamA family transporter [Streptantibioticus rubrisoli]MCQ4041494.1 EamA family transporter [Streptantibioticus rubrisoli]
MPPLKLLGGVLVMAIWGVNFATTDIGLKSFDPYLLASLRFVLAALPWAFVFKRPQVPWRYIVLYGLFFGVGQFGLLFAGMHLGFSAGLASTVMQLQAFWTIGFAAAMLGERIIPRQLLGVAVAAVGVALVAGVKDGSVTAIGTVLVVGASISWALANIVIKKAQPGDALAFTVWASLIPPVPLFLISLGMGGWHTVVQSFTGMTWGAVGSLAFMVYPSMLFGFSLWGYLLRNYRTSRVAPLTLLVPIFGMASSVLLLGERLGALKVAAIVLVLLGLGVNQFDPLGRLQARWARRKAIPIPDEVSDTGPAPSPVKGS